MAEAAPNPLNTISEPVYKPHMGLTHEMAEALRELNALTPAAIFAVIAALPPEKLDGMAQRLAAAEVVSLLTNLGPIKLLAVRDSLNALCAQPRKQPEPRALLGDLCAYGGTLKACAEAQLLCLKKSEDYNQTGGNAGTFQASRDDYFPFGLMSYAQMIHTKSQRLISLAKKPAGETNFESARDTALDMINYASFLADWLERTEADKGAE